MFPINHAIKNFNRKTNTKFAPAGEYESIITSIKPAPSYREGDAFIFCYRLTCTSSGQQYDKSEIILNDTQNNRFNMILSNLPDNGASLTCIEDLIGLQEILILENIVDNGLKYTNITGRRYVGFV